MKRSLGTDERTWCAEVYRTKIQDAVHQPTQHLKGDVMEMIAHKFDEAIRLEKNKSPSITFYFPETVLFQVLRSTKPSTLRATLEWNGLTTTYEKRLHVVWEISDKTLLSTLFGDAFHDRLYPDSEGVVDFSRKRGGRLICIISDKDPVTVKYNTLLKEITISWIFRAYKISISDGKEVKKLVI
jgi:hypothetical protein